MIADKNMKLKQIKPNRKTRYFNHQLIKRNKIEKRDYQVNITESCNGFNSLVVLPTALGKTIVAVMMVVKQLVRFRGSKILFLAPTKPLVMQHYESFKEFFKEIVTMEMIIGGKSKLKRALDINHNQIIFSTPQIVKNDLSLGSYNLKDFSLVIFDEAHKARKNYAYTFVAEEYMNTAKKPYILGLTASPGKDSEVINTLIQKLKIEKVCFKTHEDADVQQYVFPIDTYIERVDLPIEIIEIKMLLKNAVKEVIDYFISNDMFPTKNYYSKVDFIRLNQDIRAFDLYGVDYDCFHYSDVPTILEANPNKKFTCISMCISAIYLLHMEEMLTTQTPQLFADYCEKLRNRADEGSKSAKRIIHSKYFTRFIDKRLYLIRKIKSPKIDKVLQIVKDQFKEKEDSKIIIFTQFRDMATILKEEIIKLNNPLLRPDRFVGQFSKPGDRGLSQKMQQEMIKIFKQNKTSVLIATSIAEEGLDIPNVDAVIFYEPVPSEIRLIQRRGRTGRHSRGQCFIVAANDTLDDVYMNVAFRKEENMHNTLISSDDLEIISNINRSCKHFVPDEKDDKDIIQFFNDVNERKKITAEKNIELLKSINKSEEQQRRAQLLKQYGVNDITAEINSLSQQRIKRTEENLKQKRENKMNEYYERRRKKMEAKIKAMREAKQYSKK